MGKQAYLNALDLRLAELVDRTALLTLRWERAAGLERFRAFQEIERLERRKRALKGRLEQLEHAEPGLWQDIKADLQAVADDLRGGIERWIERLDRDHSARSREEMAPAPGSGPLARTHWRT
jgi:hypothetical protein